MSMRGKVLIAACALLVGGGSMAADWTQWGGPNQDFKAASAGLSAWGEDGPKELWSRELGDGYSAILVEGNRLYTMYRKGDQEAVVALDAKTGKTIWEHAYDSGPREGHVAQFGEGPRATPLIAGDKIYTIGIAGMMHCLKKTDGSVVWTQDLWGDDFKGNFLNHGYSSSPIVYKNTVIALVGGEGAGVVAFDKNNGKVKWKAQDFKNSYSTPRILDIDGEKQLVTFMATEIVGLDPDDGDLKWSYPHENQWQQNVNMPVMADKNHIFFSSPTAGARGLKLTKDGDKTKVEEIWSTRKIQFYHVTSVQDGDWVYGSTGTMGPAFMAAVNIRTGEIGWRERGMAKANIVATGDQLVALDEEGKFYLAKASPEGFEIKAEAEVFDGTAWTVPTVIGKTVYLRDKKNILALDLS